MKSAGEEEWRLAVETSSGEGRFPPKCAQSSLIVDGQSKATCIPTMQNQE